MALLSTTNYPLVMLSSFIVSVIDDGTRSWRFMGEDCLQLFWQGLADWWYGPSNDVSICKLSTLLEVTCLPRLISLLFVRKDNSSRHELDTAEEYYLKALQVNPNYVSCMREYGNLMNYRGHIDISQRFYDRAKAILAIIQQEKVPRTSLQSVNHHYVPRL